VERSEAKLTPNLISRIGQTGYCGGIVVQNAQTAGSFQKDLTGDTFTRAGIK